MGVGPGVPAGLTPTPPPPAWEGLGCEAEAGPGEGVLWAFVLGGAPGRWRPPDAARSPSTLWLLTPVLPMTHFRGERGIQEPWVYMVETVTPDSREAGAWRRWALEGCAQALLHQGRRLPASLGLGFPIWGQTAAGMASGAWSPGGWPCRTPGCRTSRPVCVVLSSGSALPCRPHPSGWERFLCWVWCGSCLPFFLCPQSIKY